LLLSLQGFKVPEPLRKYIPGSPEFIAFAKELPKDSTSQKLKGKAEKAAATKPKASGEGPSDKLANLRI
jgi:seryl-tRNA synthetase